MKLREIKKRGCLYVDMISQLKDYEKKLDLEFKPIVN